MATIERNELLPLRKQSEGFRKGPIQLLDFIEINRFMWSVGSLLAAPF